mmetsp:Transcript_69019/g.173904  ORF Transcript_69019/g.173904 Transcript_69019/m.173904 type:complete len:254 (+) Transcript_69019:74-835(+)
MGTVQGVYMKYVAMSSISYATLYALAPEVGSDEAISFPFQCVLSLLAYLSLLNGIIAMLFRMEEGMELLGKEAATGRVPPWSYVLFVGFHFPTWLYTRLHGFQDKANGIAVADEVAQGWWLGGRYGNELGKTWAGIVDLTCEFPELSKGKTSDAYLLLRCWDGVPPSPAQLEEATEFAVRKRATGDILVHCAHGRGRSTTVMCACLVKQGLFKSWEDAFVAVKKKRPVVKLNSRMRQALTTWQETYITSQKRS